MRKVTYANTHAEVFIPGGPGSMGKVFPSQEKRLNNLEMHVDDTGLTLSFMYKFQNYEVLIPSANVVLMVLAAEEKPTKASKAVA